MLKCKRLGCFVECLDFVEMNDDVMCFEYFDKCKEEVMIFWVVFVFVLNEFYDEDCMLIGVFLEVFV